jgi:hypothetical protein
MKEQKLLSIGKTSFKKWLAETFDMGEGIRHAFDTYQWGIKSEGWGLPNIDFGMFQRLVSQTPDTTLSPDQMRTMKWNNTRVGQWVAFKGQGLDRNGQARTENDPQFVKIIKSLQLQDRSGGGGHSDVQSVLYHMNNALRGNTPPPIAVKEGEYVTMLDGDHRTVGYILVNKPMKIKILNIPQETEGQR